MREQDLLMRLPGRKFLLQAEFQGIPNFTPNHKRILFLFQQRSKWTSDRKILKSAGRCLILPQCVLSQ